MAIIASLFTLVFFLDVAMGQSACSKLDRDVEIVFVLDASDSIKNNDYSSMISTVRKFPDLAQMGEQHVRVAVVVFSTTTKIEVELTADVQMVRKLSDKREVKGITNTHLALNQANEIVFAKARPNAMRVVVLITDGAPTVSVPWPKNFEYDPRPTEAAAKKLRDANVVMFAAYVGQAPPWTLSHLATVTNDSSHVMPVANFSELAVVIKEKLMKALQCYYEEVCYFNAEQQCQWEWRRPNVTGTCCTNEPPKGGPHCDPQKCKATCDQWQWTNDSTCDQKMPGETIKLQRQGPRPADKKFAHCPETMEFVCPLENANSTTRSPSVHPTDPIDVTGTPVSCSKVPSPGSCSSNPGFSFGSYLGKELQCLQSESMRIWFEKIIVDLLYEANEAEVNGKTRDFKQQADSCIRAVGA